MQRGSDLTPLMMSVLMIILSPRLRKNKSRVKLIKDKEVYGHGLNLCCVFDSNDWFRSPSLKPTEKCVYVFAKLSKLSRSNSDHWKNTSKRAAGMDMSKVGQYKMHEYSLSEHNAGLNFDGAATVLCRITHDFSKKCTINLKSGTKIACKVSRSTSEVVHEKEESTSEAVHEMEENSYNNVEGTST
ncbi:hypothetical protein POM88_019205 [Heracleum sosnowskyi]|uniref:Uncharacterized protein n=1 Tax=Heracleum sosnowskyi TaxID=360622 RepID=A0AAD8IRX3_9APIA|nr:hypothetical protein POM88_019205 [Heracleum sosnowskyi]